MVKFGSFGFSESLLTRGMVEHCPPIYGNDELSSRTSHSTHKLFRTRKRSLGVQQLVDGSTEIQNFEFFAFFTPLGISSLKPTSRSEIRAPFQSELI
jgi:hypothetical protein